MKNELIINVSPTQTRIARLEGGSITELIVERVQEVRYAGNIYKGKIVRVLPGMQAAFAEIGLERTAFLYVSDIAPDLAAEEMMAEEEELPPERPRFDRNQPRDIPQIQDLVREGQEILVQIARDPIGTKGARLTTHVSLPGRFLVYMPTVNHVGVSRRIPDDDERVRLKAILNKIVSRDEGGFIARTLSEKATEQELRQDMEYLIRLWNEIRLIAEEKKAPSLVHSELSVVLRAVRDLFTPDIDHIVIDSPDEKKKIEEFIHSFSSPSQNVVELYDGAEPIFDAYGIEVEISRALGKKVWLKSGGYIILDQTEALTAIDVNTGKFVGKRNLEDTILKTNLEAVKEIAYQLRLRDMGGIIIIDFIDMERHANREKVYQALKEHLKSDRAKTTITKITDLGLVEMTRKRTRESLSRLLCEPCFYCEGRGYLKSRATICHEILRELKRGLVDYHHPTITVYANPTVAELLLDEERPSLEEWEARSGKKVLVKSREDFHLEQFDVTDKA
ncbi:MAG: Rne/Rng family ribonuclease [Deltaproteobacteria bacterium]|nr:Rne/Rng family ribonuclease [Deltaproteobacteria bacterium]